MSPRDGAIVRRFGALQHVSTAFNPEYEAALRNFGNVSRKSNTKTNQCYWRRIAIDRVRLNERKTIKKQALEN